MASLASAAAGLTYLFGRLVGDLLLGWRSGEGSRPPRQRSSVSTKIRPAGRSASGRYTYRRPGASCSSYSTSSRPSARTTNAYVFPGHVAPRVAVAIRPAPAQTRHGDFAIRDWPCHAPRGLEAQRSCPRDGPRGTAGDAGAKPAAQPGGYRRRPSHSRYAWASPSSVRTCSEGTLQVDWVRETSRQRSRPLGGGQTTPPGLARSGSGRRGPCGRGSRTSRSVCRVS